MKKQILALLLVLVLLPGLSPAARAESVQAIAGTVTATDLYGYGGVGDVVLKGDTTLILDRDLTARSIRGDYALTVQDQGGHTLTVRMPTDEHVITANGSGHGISVKRLRCDASLDVLSRKDGLNIDGDIFFTGATLAVTSKDGDAVYSRNGGVELHSTAIFCTNHVMIDGGTVRALGAGNGINCASFVMENGSLTARGHDKHAIVTRRGGIDILYGSTLDASSRQETLYCTGDNIITLNGDATIRCTG